MATDRTRLGTHVKDTTPPPTVQYFVPPSQRPRDAAAAGVQRERNQCSNTRIENSNALIKSDFFTRLQCCS